jgi:HK97 family phage major capsid protein
MGVLTETAKAEFRKAEKDASEAWAEFDKLRKDLQEKTKADPNVLLNEDSPEFKEAHTANEAYGQKADIAAALQKKLMQAMEMEGVSDPEVEMRGGGKGEGTKGGIVGDLLGATLGEKMAEGFINSDAYKEIQRKHQTAPDSWRIGGELDGIPGLDRRELKALFKSQGGKALVSGAGATTGDVVIIDDRQAGIVDLPRNPRAILPLVATGTTDSDTVEWVELTSRVNNAAERAEAATTTDTAADAPESGFVLTIRETSVREIKHYIPATRIGVADAGQLRTIIDSELLEGLQDRLELQILAGNGTAPNLRGILNTAGIQTQARGADPQADAVYKAITKILLANYVPDAVVLNPNDWQTVRLTKDTAGGYTFGPPSAGDTLQMWGHPVRLSANLTTGTGLVGAFRRGATLWLRQGANVSASDSHSDWFLRGIIAVLASMRAAFGVPRPLAFCTVTGL